MQPTFAIADARGTDHAYSVRPVAPGWAEWAVEIVHQESEATYRVSLTRGLLVLHMPGVGVQQAPEQCKHTAAIADLKAIAEALAPSFASVRP